MTRRVRPILQMEASECGAASLAMVLGWHGCHVPLEELRQECGVTRDGSKASNLLKAALRYGLEAKAYKKEPEQLAALPFPLILHWNFNHFVVLESIDGRRARICDPGYGRRTVGLAEFGQAFTGVVLTFRRLPTFQPRGRRPSLLVSLGRYLSGTEARLAALVCVGLAFVVPGLAVPLIAQRAVDQALVPGRPDALLPFLVALGITAAVRALVSAAKDEALLRLELSLAASAAHRCLTHLLHLPLAFFTQRLTGEVAQRVTLHDDLARTLTGGVVASFVDAVLAVLFLGLLFSLSPALALIGLGCAALMVLGLVMFSGPSREAQLRLQKDEGLVAGIGLSGLRMVETLKSMAQEGAFLTRLAGHQASQLHSEQQVQRLSGTLSNLLALVAGTNTVLVLLVGGAEVMAGRMSWGTLVAVQTLAAGFLQPVLGLGELASRIQQCALALVRVEDVLDHPAVPDRPAELAGACRKLRGELVVEDLGFAYDRLGPPLIQGVGFRVGPGQRVALLGGSGSGKSTVARLLAGLYTPDTGRICIDGDELADLPRTVVARSLALVDQELAFFEGTVFANLTLGRAGYDPDAVVRAARDAGIHDDIVARPGGYESLVEEGGRNFSGGQRQRLEIARALVLDPTLLILDEATSALDALTEELVDRNLRRRGCACVVVAHRLSTVRDSDEILVFERGRVVERGCHDELLALGGVYRDLVGADRGA